MVDWVGLLLGQVNFYCHVVGLSNFEHDWRTGCVYTRWGSTLYAAAVNIAILILHIYFWTRHIDFSMLLGNKLHVYAVIAMSSLRTIAGLSTVLNRWHRRSQLMDLVRKILRLFSANIFPVNSWSRFACLIKILTSFATDLFQFAITVQIMGGMNSAQMVGLALQFWTSTILNLAVSQHYLVMLFIRSQYQHINIELQKLVEECKMLSHIPKRKGVFMTRCCYLSDKLDDIAKLQSHLQWIITQLGAIIGLQGVMVYGGYYFSSVVALYMTYSLFKYGHENLNLTLDIVIMAFVWNFFFYLDAMLNLLNTLFVLDDHNKMVRLLEERTLFSSSLDVRLEESFEKLQLQLVRNPMSINVMKLFPVTRSSTAAMCGSIITHSIFLIQYDMENF